MGITRRGLLLSLAAVSCRRCDGRATGPPDSAADLAEADKQFDAKGLQDALDRIASWLTKEAPPVAKALRPGLSDEELDRMRGDVALSEELRILYRWHDGGDVELPFVYYHAFLPLAEALKPELMGAPLVSFLYFEGEGLYVRPRAEAKALPVHHFLNEVPERPVVHANVTTLMKVWAAALDAGIVKVQDPNGAPAFTYDEAKLAAIHRKLDPVPPRI